MKKIPHSQPFFDKADEGNLLNVLQKRYVSRGDCAIRFGEKVAGTLSKKWAIPTQSGTDALVAALYILNLPKKSRVIVPAYMCGAAVDALKILDLTPVPIDINRKTLAVEPKWVNEEDNIQAVIAAHLFGIPAPFHLINKKNLIEDCAQTLDIDIENGIKVGSCGKLSICSFYATKLLTTGHGGAVSGNEELLKERLDQLFSHDKQDSFSFHLHYYMSDLNASLGLSQLNKLDYLIKKRTLIASRYNNVLTGSDRIAHTIYSRYLIVTHEANEAIIDNFQVAGIEAKRPVYKPVYQYLNLPSENFPNSQWAHNHIVSVPLYPGMSEENIIRIKNFLGEHKDEMCCWPPA
ncbi:MAG: DegT/DnrJ/EryC1/StrS family aminotransferase [Verrucomicrobiota bacterium]|nr:DegT/DnrJ/EryC1/StrS family aminotransferase [Verrucomicrobiota bacterium]